MLTVAPTDAGARLDQWLARALGCSRREAQRLIAAGAVQVDHRRADKGTLLSGGAVVRVEGAPPTPLDLVPRPEPERPLAIVYEDEALVALDKPAGMASHPLRPMETGTLANTLLARFPECATVADDPREGGLAHRLDIDTSGLILAARSRAAWVALRRAFATGAVQKEYLALVVGSPPPRGVIAEPLVHAGRRVRVARERDRHPLSAKTSFEVLRAGLGYALVRAASSSGRLHQIRAHLAHLGYPLVGDALYGGPPPAPHTRGHLLHAATLSLPHPTSGAPLTLVTPLPPDRARAVAELLGWP